MSEMNIYCMPGAAASAFAGQFLEEAGVTVSRHITPGLTHWLLPVPTRVMPAVPPGVTVVGGNLSCPGVDLLKDPWYLAQNAAITARGKRTWMMTFWAESVQVCSKFAPKKPLAKIFTTSRGDTS